MSPRPTEGPASDATLRPPLAPTPRSGSGGRRGAARWGTVGVLGLVLSSALVVYLALELDLGAVARAVGAARPGSLVLAALAYTALFPLRGLRWALLLRPLAPVPVELATRGFLVGFMANNLLPARLGDVVRAFVLARRASVPAPASFATVMLERVFDGVVVVGVLAVSLAVLPLDADPGRSAQLRAVAGLMGMAFGGALTVAALLAAFETPTLRRARALLRPLSPGIRTFVLGALEKLASGLHVLRSPRHAAAVAGLSLLVWTLEVVVYVFVTHALGLEVSFLGLAFVMAVLTLGLTAPSAPGFVGVFEALVIPSLALLGIPAADGAAFALVLHAVHYLPGTLLGLVAAWTLGMKVKDLGRRRPAAVHEGSGNEVGAPCRP